MALANPRKAADLIVQIEKTLKETQKAALNAQGVAWACAAYISKIPGANTINVSELLEHTARDMLRLDRLAQQTAIDAIQNIHERAQGGRDSIS